VTLQFNSNDDPGNGTAGILPTGGILFGSAGEIDFGNDNRSITAINDANFWTALANLSPLSTSLQILARMSSDMVSAFVTMMRLAQLAAGYRLQVHLIRQPSSLFSQVRKTALRQRFI